VRRKAHKGDKVADLPAHAFALGTFARAPGAAPFIGVVQEQRWVTPLAALGTFPATMLELLGHWDENEPALARAVAAGLAQRARLPIESLHTFAPVMPRQILCTGANYRKHVIGLVVAQGAGADTEGMTVEERRAHVERRTDARARDGIPYAFPKLAGCVAGPFDDIVAPRDAQQFDWELELGVVIGRTAWRVPRERALEVVAGYTIVNDLTRRELVYRSDLKSLGSDWLRAKSGPGFMPTGPFIVPRRFVPQPQALHMELRLNGQVMQSESTADMLFDIARQIEYLSSYVRLLPGDLVATGSPAGNGMHHGRFIQPGDLIEATISGLGTQRAHCVAEGD